MYIFISLLEFHNVEDAFKFNLWTKNTKDLLCNKTYVWKPPLMAFPPNKGQLASFNCHMEVMEQGHFMNHAIIFTLGHNPKYGEF